MQYTTSLHTLWTQLTRRLSNQNRVIATASGISLLIWMLRLLGLLQPLELFAFDSLIRLRPSLPQDERIVIVGIDESDLQALGWPIPDNTLATLLETIAEGEPDSIGLDIYRDLPLNPGHQQLRWVMQKLPNLIGIERIDDLKSPRVPPPPALDPNTQAGFNNVMKDVDGKVRRGMLYMHTEDETGERIFRRSFALQIALKYLSPLGIEEKPSSIDPTYMQLGEATFEQFQPNDGPYVRADNKGYQFLADFRGPKQTFTTLSIEDVLNGNIKPEVFRDRIVLIGLTAVSLKDFVPIPYSNPDQVPGVEAQANFISFILDLATGERSAIKTLSDPFEGMWIVVWSGLGAMLAWKVRVPHQLILTALLGMGGLMTSSYLLLLYRWWFPLVPPALAFIGSAFTILAHFAHQEGELKRSTEFLQGVIDTIPDPVFVKDRDHHWIVLNQAYSRLVGYPLETLMQKSDYDLFLPQEAERFWQQDEQIFSDRESNEQEEEFTDAAGIHRRIATKRSLHSDSGGNLFLVGVIRDITEQKEREAELQRLAEDLKRRNAELKLSEGHMRHMANHDVLTGLANRKLFEEKLQEGLVLAQANEKMLATFFLDLDGFKQINDTLGHDTGDLVIKEVGQRLKKSLRGTDTVARLGGDEFTIILPEIPSKGVAIRVAEKVIAAVTQPLPVKESELNVTLSLGISLYPEHGQTLEALVKSADRAMYQAKIQGKNRYLLADSPESV